MVNIPNIYHIFYDKIDNNIFLEYEYYSIKSIIEINNPIKIYFNYIILPKGIFWDKISDLLILNIIKININKNILIFSSLLNYGGIYINLNSICIKPFNELLNKKFIKSRNNEIICCEKKSDIAYKFLKLYMNNKQEFESNYDIVYDTLFGNIYTEIYDYSFSPYFNIINNYYFLFLGINNINNCLNQITIYNLLVRHVLGYKYINNIININTNKYNLINNIDIIYWINLEKSIERRNNMIKILNNFNNIPNEKINAIDGNLEYDIKSKYFYEENNQFPSYSNKEYAILLSHLNTIEKYVNLSNINYGVALICEDDLSLDFINYWDKDINTIIKEIPIDWDIIMLGYFSLNLQRSNTYQKWNNEWSAISYLINHKSIYKVNDLKKNNKWICNKTDLMVSDNYIFSKFNTYVYNKPYFTFPNNNNSSVHEDHLNYHKIYKISNYLILEKIDS